MTLTADDWELDVRDRRSCGALTTPTAASHGRRPRSSSRIPPVATSCPASRSAIHFPKTWERACLETVKGPLVRPPARSPGQGRAGPGRRLRADYWYPSTGAGDPGLPPSAVGLLQRYRLPIV